MTKNIMLNNNTAKKIFKSTCCYCGVGCGVEIHKDNKGNIKVEGDPEHPSSKGMLCSKGMNLHYTVTNHSDRLLYPQMRYNKDMPLLRVSWDEALNRTAAVFKSIINRYGPDSVAFYVSGQCLTEEYYVINKLMKGFIGSNNIDTNSRLCMSSAVAAYKMSLGEDAVPICYDDIELSDTIFVTGANPAWCHPILWRRVEAHKNQNPDVKVIVVDPRKTQTCAIADLHLQIVPGTDIVLLEAIARILIERGNIDVDFIEQHTVGFDNYKSKVLQRPLNESAKICGIKASDIRWAAEYIGRAKAFLSMWTMGLNQSAVGVNKNLSLINLHLITGQIGKPGSGPFSLTGQPNAMGGRETGGLANMLPAHRDLANEEHRRITQNFWGGTTIQAKPGLTATEMFDALHSGKLKAIWIVCTNPLVSLPDVTKAEEALAKANFVVVQEISQRAETLKYADVILPAAAWAEKEGTMTNSERRITYLPKVTDPPGEALPDFDIICRFARKMGFHAFMYKNTEEAYVEYTRLTAQTNINIEGLNYDILRQKRSIQWPYQSSSDNDTKRLFTNKKFYTPHQKAIIHTVPDEFTSEQPNDSYPLVLTTGRIRDQWHTMSKTGKVNKLKQHISHNYVEIHKKDAALRNIKDGDLVKVFNTRGETIVRAKVSDDVRQGLVFMPMHWGKINNRQEQRTNNLTHKLLDPISKEPDFKYCAVQVVPYKKPHQKIIIAGAGAAAFAFVKNYRSLNDIDTICVFSKEEHPFYNRVMLPEYISGQQSWNKLQKHNPQQEKDWNIHILRNTEIVNIDRENKKVTDSQGHQHTYDILVLATGSRPRLPEYAPAHMKGIFTLRTKYDADKLLEEITSGQHVVIVGGGLLGLELAAALNEINIQVTIVHRSSRLMDRQLDNISSQILAEEIRDRNISLLLNDEIINIIGNGSVQHITLKSGQKLPCSAIVFAIGTQPNIEIAKQAGLLCRRGVQINEYFQTSDPHIYAIGEIAEFNGSMWGITAAAEQQAHLLARYLNGDVSAFYEGSVSMNILKIQGLQLCSIGITEIPANSSGYEEIVFIDRSKHYYKKCIVHNDKLVGAILMGDKSEFTEFKELIEKKTELSEKRLALLRSNLPTEKPEGKIVCSCNNVGEGNIRKRIESGIDNLHKICELTGAGTGCGSCKPEIKLLIEQYWVSA
ncbi:MAG: molybdopterin-dependent oxidoreductase [Cytophagaceae bacterium]|nr:molybdopterin-dependent oxidoreductase [Cytophagaceae bacterium]MDW8457144.1 molybdopterin-dependent oxidoreductase [Cytophagaceae bacterium]